MIIQKEGTATIHSDLENFVQGLKLKGIFSTGLGKIIDDKKLSDERRGKNLTDEK